MHDVHLIGIQIKTVKKAREQLEVSVLQRCLSYRESNKGGKERQGTTSGVRFTEVHDVHLIGIQIKTVKKAREQLEVSVLQRCLSYRESNKGGKERQVTTLGVHFTEVSNLKRVK